MATGSADNTHIMSTANQETDLKYCLKRRRTIKGQITHFHTFLDGMDADPDYDHIQARLESLKNHYDEFKTVQIRLEMQQPENTDHDTAREEIESSYFHGVARARALIRQAAASAGIASEGTSHRSTPTPSITTPSTFKRLPDLNPPKFDGNLENWATFKARFTSMIGKNAHLNETDKLEYLQSSLTGRAAKVIEALEVTDSNYDDAWQLLVKKYDNTRKAILRHVNILNDLEPLKDDSAEAIEELVDTVRQHIRSLKNLGQSNDQWDCFVIGLLTTKISRELTHQWELTLPDNKLPPYTSLVDFLAKRANCSDAKQTGTSRVAKGSSANKGTSAGKNRGGHHVFTTDIKAPECPLCKDKHWIYQCSKFINITIEERIKAAQQAHLCLNCLRSQHKTKLCKSKGRCRTCEKPHHTMLHLQRDQVTAPSSS